MVLKVWSIIFTYNPEGPDNGGASDVYVIDMIDNKSSYGAL